MKTLYTLLLILVILISGFFIYEKFSYLNIEVKFEDLEPFKGKMDVYYKGFKIGKSGKIYTDKDFSNSYLELKLKPKKINLPENITADIKISEDKPYIKILYPSSPAVKRLANGTIIKGEYEKDIDSIINETINGENVQNIMGNASNLIENANNTVQSLGYVFDEITSMLKEVRPVIISSAKNLEKTTKHLSIVSDNLSNALDRTTTKNSIDNIEETTENLKRITSDINDITTQIENVSIPIINSALCEVNGTVKNTNEITNGIKCTLKKRMGLFKLFFGKPEQACQNCKK